MDYREKRIEFANTPGLSHIGEEWFYAVIETEAVTITGNTETGEHLWSIAPIDDDDMWLNSLNSLRDARVFCESLGYEVKGVRRLERDDKQDHLHRRPHP